MSTPEDVLKLVDDIDWESIIVIGCDEAGNIYSMSSRMTMERIVLLLETTKWRLFSGQCDSPGTKHYDA